jgi:predicted Zn-dependent protease with MMP-like domain
MKRARFNKLVEEALDALPAKFHTLLDNVAVVVEDSPPPDENGVVDEDLMGLFDGVPKTEKSVWDAAPPDRVILYQRNIEAYAAEAAAEENLPVEDVIREEVRLTVLHELGHYFGMEEDQLEDV